MSQVSNGGPNDPRRVNRAVPAPLPGIQESLATPGLEITPPVSRGVALAAQLDRALGAVGQLATTVDYVERRKIEEQAHLDAKNDVLLRGQASVNARIAAAQISEKVKTGEINPPTNPEDDRALVDSTWRQNVPEGSPDAYVNQYEKDFAPEFAQALASRRGVLFKEHEATDLELGSQGIATVTSSEELSERMDSLRARFPNIPEQDLYAKTVLPAMQAAATAPGGDRARFEFYQAELKDANGNAMFPTEQNRLAVALQQSEDREAQNNREFFDNGLAAVQFDNQPYSLQREMVSEAESNGLVDATHAENKRREIDVMEREQGNQNKVEQRRLEIESWKQKALSLDSARVVAGQAWSIPEKETVPLSDGSEHTIERKDRLDAAMNDQFARIAAQYPNDPHAAQLKQFELAAKNGYAIPQTKLLLSSGVSAITEATTTADASKGQPAIPPQSAAAYQAYLDLDRAAPGLLPDMLSQRDREFYERVRANTQDPMIGSSNLPLAMSTAARDMTEGRQVMDTSALDRLTKRVREVTTAGKFDGADNIETVRSEVERHAKYIAGRNGDINSAVDRAIKIVTDEGVTVNGHWTPAGGMEVPADLRSALPAVSKSVVKEYADANPALFKANGLSPGDATLDYHPSTGFWYVIDKRYGLPVSDPANPSAGVYTTKQLAARPANAAADAVVKAGQRMPSPTIDDLLNPTMNVPAAMLKQAGN